MRTCATASRVLAEPLEATAATARTWLLVEQPGPWGAKALTQSHLDPQLGRDLEQAAGPHGVRVGLIRRPGPHADRHEDVHRRCYLAHTLPGSAWVRTVLLPGDPGKLRDLDFSALGAGDPTRLPDGWHPHEGDPLALVCTNAKRDRCCALLGRPLAAELAASGAGDVWETTHIGGHRFAPTMLVLPHGYAYGRISAPAVKGLLHAVREGRVLTEGCRGRSAWSRPGQAADLAVRAHSGEAHADALTVLGIREDAPRHWTVTVAHTDGRSWRVRVSAVDDELPVPTGCGATPGSPLRMRVDAVEESGTAESSGTATGSPPP